jgi:hypothetical protein
VTPPAASRRAASRMTYAVFLLLIS